MNTDLDNSERDFIREVRSFLATALTDDLRAGARATVTVFAEPDIGRLWQQILHRKGWLAYQWPADFGGPGWTPVQRYIFERECARAGAPELPVLGLKLLASVLHAFGTPEQQQNYLPRILSGEDYWCQGFSEPGAGSDLAALKTRAQRQNDGYRVNGSKLWTTHAHFANRMFCLARTDPEVKAQRGISFLLIDMDQPGVDVRPIIGMAGDHEVNAVFLDDVHAPLDGLVGEEGQGWSIAKYLLEQERGGSCHAPRLLMDVRRLRVAIESQAIEIGAAADDPLFVAELLRIELEAMALETTELRILAELAKGDRPGPQTSLVKMVASNLRQRIDAAAMRLFGYDGLQFEVRRPLYGPDAPRAVGARSAQCAPLRYLNSRAWTIFGGSNEVQRTIIARSVLGL